MRKFWRAFMLAAAVGIAASAEGYAGGQAANPGGYGGTPAMMIAQTVATPDFQGMTVQEAQAANVVVSTKAGVAARPIFSKLNTTGPTDGIVAAQTPTAGTRVYPGRQTATLTMKSAQIVVPALRGMSVADARSRLSQSSLILGQVSGDATLKIATQTPAAGATVLPLSVVDVVMAAPADVVGATGAIGKPPAEIKVTLPKVLTLSEAAAATKLSAAGLGKPLVLGPGSGVVVRQTPAAGTIVAKGSQVRLVMGTQKNDIIIVQQKSNPWGWYAAGGVVLLGAVGAFVVAKKTPSPHPKPPPLPPATTTMVTKPNVASGKIAMKTDPALLWSIQLRDRPAAGAIAVKGDGEIKGERKE
jgi:beta-lactam-binding protein with PASTA domain